MSFEKARPLLGDHFEYIGNLGSGANASCCLVYNKLTERREVLKTWIPRKNQKKVDKERFLHELRKNSALEFDGIARIYTADYDEESDIYYCTMQYIEGETLAEWLSQERDLASRYQLLKGVLGSMERVYSLGFYHGDLHAKNILVDPCFIPVIIDFGTSFFADNPQKSHDRDAKMLQELCYKVVPELKNLRFITPDLHKMYPSKDLCDLMQEALDIIWSIEHVTENTDHYGMISNIVLPCAILVMNHPILNKDIVFEYVKSYISSKGDWTEAMAMNWNLALEKD